MTNGMRFFSLLLLVSVDIYYIIYLFDIKTTKGRFGWVHMRVYTLQNNLSIWINRILHFIISSDTEHAVM